MAVPVMLRGGRETQLKEQEILLGSIFWPDVQTLTLALPITWTIFSLHKHDEICDYLNLLRLPSSRVSED